MDSNVIQEIDFAVIGGGTTGLSAAYYAAAAGHSTALFEQYDIGNNYASSDGYSRMFRVMYSEENMAQLAESAFGLWHEIEDSSKQTLLKKNGIWFYGTPAQTVEGNLQQCQDVMTEMGIPYSRYSQPELLSQYPAFKQLPNDYFGLNQPSGASIVVKDSLGTFARMAQAKGARLYTHCPVQIQRPSQADGPYILTTPSGTFAARHLIIAPGAWSNPVLKPFGLQLNLKIWQMTVAYFNVPYGSQWPMWYEFGPEVGGIQQLFYGFPPMEYPDKVKASADFTNDIFDDPSQCTYQPDPKILKLLSDFMTTRFQHVDPNPQLPVTCLYTMSSDAQIVLDTLPGFKNIAVLTGESGRAFKYTPLFGRILVQLATTGKSTYDISEFRITRPGILK